MVLGRDLEPSRPQPSDAAELSGEASQALGKAADHTEIYKFLAATSGKV